MRMDGPSSPNMASKHRLTSSQTIMRTVQFESRSRCFTKRAYQLSVVVTLRTREELVAASCSMVPGGATCAFPAAQSIKGTSRHPLHGRSFQTCKPTFSIDWIQALAVSSVHAQNVNAINVAQHVLQRYHVFGVMCVCCVADFTRNKLCSLIQRCGRLVKVATS